MWYDKIVVIIIILLRVKNVIEIETHNYLIHVPLYKKLQNLTKEETIKNTNSEEFLEGLF